MRAFHLVCALQILAVSPVLAQTPEDLAQQLKDPQARVRRLAAESLGKQKVEAAIPALAELLNDPEASVREAAKDMSNLGPVLRPTLPSSVTEAAIAAALRIDPNCGEALARAALPDLTAALKSKDEAVLQAAGYALAKLGPRAKPALPALQE